MVGIGAAVDFLAGSKKRAPIWMQHIGLEWFYRFIQEPRRLFKRYIVLNSRFILMVIRQIISGKL
jgi:N-acetylglucosaminyldiphosphoundecaprenol N-acetyl-beta-D-mannosaminyltransferase